MSKQFKEKIDSYGYYSCVKKNKIGKGNNNKCGAEDNQHSCHFVLHNPATSTVIKLQPKFPRKEQNRLDAYSQDYFVKPEISRLRRPPK